MYMYAIVKIEIKMILIKIPLPLLIRKPYPLTRKMVCSDYRKYFFFIRNITKNPDFVLSVHCLSPENTE